jgi:hypothetical protein
MVLIYLYIYCSPDIKKSEMGVAFWWGDLRERDHLEELSIDGWII